MDQYSFSNYWYFFYQYFNSSKKNPANPTNPATDFNYFAKYYLNRLAFLN